MFVDAYELIATSNNLKKMIDIDANRSTKKAIKNQKIKSFHS